MRKLFLSLIVLLVGVVSTQAQQGGAGAAGAISSGRGPGPGRGGSTGGFELTLEKGKDGSTAGRVSVTGEPAYKATIRTLTFDDKR